MTSACDPLGSFARGLADSGAASLMSVSRGTEEIASAMADYMRSSFRAGGEFARAFLAAASVKDAVAIQTGYARQSYEAWVAGAAKIGVLYAELAAGACEPFEWFVVTPKD
ncbi:MAG: Phasin [Proteobacteria bacterium]|jgi:hypothetical protein|nr:MAG: Phasin [Pseudomonadota bacterium]